MKKIKKKNKLGLLIIMLAIFCVGTFVSVKALSVDDILSGDFVLERLGDTNSKCPKGQYDGIALLMHKCITCPKGYYCPGDDNRYLCVNGTTKDMGSTDASKCITGTVTCSDGEYLKNGKCAVCPKGSYCYGGDQYLCPSGTTTKNTSSKKVSECIGANYITEFIDTTPGKSCYVSFTVSGVSEGMGYVNVSLEDLATYTTVKQIKGYGKVGVLVHDEKLPLTTVKRLIPSGTQFGTSELSLSRTSTDIIKGKTTTIGINVKDLAGMITISSSKSNILKIVSVDTSKCGGSSIGSTCPDGKYLSGGSCVLCPKGSYCNNNKKYACPSGTTTASTGESSSTACIGNNYIEKFIDTDMGKTCKLSYTIAAVTPGTAYINVVLKDVTSYSNVTKVTGTGRVGVVVKNNTNDTGTSPNGIQFATNNFSLNKTSASLVTGKTMVLELTAKDVAGQININSTNEKVVKVVSISSPNCVVATPKPKVTPKPTTLPLTAGDINGDGKISAIDLVWLKEFLDKKRTLTVDQIKRADVDGNGKVNTADYNWLHEIIYGINPTPTPTATPRPLMSGDINGDGKISSVDLVWLKEFLDKKRTLTVEQIKRADVDGNGMVNMVDYKWLDEIINGVKPTATPTATPKPKTCSSYGNVSACISAGCSWVNGVCTNAKQTATPRPKVTPKPTATPIVKPCQSYTTSATCSSAKCYWYNNKCNSTKPTATPTPKVTPKPTATPIVKPCQSYTTSATCSSAKCYWYNNKCNSTKPTATPTPKVTAKPTPKVTPKPTVKPTATPTPKVTAKPTVTPKPTNCAAGKYLDGSTCVTCPKGSYCYGNKKYTCPSGSTTNSTGASRISACDGANYVEHFIDTGVGKECKVVYTVSGRSVGKAYINISLEDLVTYNNVSIKEYGRVGILVEDPSSETTDTVPNGKKFTTTQVKLSGLTLTFEKGKTKKFAIKYSNVAGMVGINSTNLNVTRIKAVDTSDCDGNTTLTCGTGEYLKDGKCTVCPKGSYCIKNTKYACPDGTTTKVTGSTSKSKCA